MCKGLSHVDLCCAPAWPTSNGKLASRVLFFLAALPSHCIPPSLPPAHIHFYSPHTTCLMITHTFDNTHTHTHTHHTPLPRRYNNVVMDDERKMQADVFLGLKSRTYFPTLPLPYRCVCVCVWRWMCVCVWGGCSRVLHRVLHMTDCSVLCLLCGSMWGMWQYVAVFGVVGAHLPTLPLPYRRVVRAGVCGCGLVLTVRVVLRLAGIEGTALTHTLLRLHLHTHIFL